ncbi:MAG TPA: hypothetical protein VNI55_09335 [Gaiellaceae bacterium]|nr:hypothetical protein [Gaiellaceae bacterium]
MSPPLAHGGVAGTVIEFLLVLGLVVVFVVIAVRERRAGRKDDEA